jgi:Fe-S-cluster-containing dehydrogenase component
MVIDVSRCDGCYNCFIACKDEYAEQAHPGYSAAQPMTGQDWMKIKPVERGQYPKVKQDYIPIPCMQCENPACGKGSGQAISVRPDGIVMLDPERATEEDIISRCPYRRIYWNVEARVAQKCNFCAHLLDAGWKEPRCVEACPTGTLIFGDLEDPESEVARLWDRATPMHPEYGLGERVRYLNLPKNFVAGAVVFGDSDECAKGVTVTLEGDGKKVAVATDAFGDFEFEGLPSATSYTVTIASEGYEPVTLDVKTHTSVYLGDIVLHRTPVQQTSV